MAYVPTIFTKPGREPKIATDVFEDVQLRFEGWRPLGSPPVQVDPQYIAAHMSDINELEVALDLKADQEDLELKADQSVVDERYRRTWMSTDKGTTAVAISTAGNFARWTGGHCLTIPPTRRKLIVTVKIPILITTAGTGCIGFSVMQSDTGALVDSYGDSIGGSFTLSNTFDALTVVSATGVIDADPVNWRNFCLAAGVFRISGSLAASVQGATANGSRRSVMIIQEK